jgi:AcrR family transcriptional regulator
MPRLWNDTIEAHRRDVRAAILEAASTLVAKNGLQSLTMSEIADEAGIGRATLYKYFADVEAILLAWHEHHVHGHLQQLAAVRDQPGSAGQRLAAVLEAYALICHEHEASDVSALLHRGEHVAHARQQLRKFVQDLLAEGAQAKEIRTDVAPDELASYCLHALEGAASLPSKAAVHRLVAVTLSGLHARGGDGRPPRPRRHRPPHG